MGGKKNKNKLKNRAEAGWGQKILKTCRAGPGLGPEIRPVQGSSTAQQLPGPHHLEHALGMILSSSP